MLNLGFGYIASLPKLDKKGLFGTTIFEKGTFLSYAMEVSWVPDCKEGNKS